MQHTNHNKHTRKAALVSAMAFMAVYVLTYLEHASPIFHFSRATSQQINNSTHTLHIAYEGTGQRNESSRTIISSSSITEVTRDWASRCQQRGHHFARAFVSRNNPLSTSPNSSNNNHPQHSTTTQPPPYWCTQEAYDKKSCKTPTQRLCQPKGLLFVKTPKTGSTTISRIMKRIVSHVAQRSSNVTICQHREDHVNGAGLWYANRDPHHSFLLASVRDPAQRAISRFFWSYVTRHSNGTEEPIFMMDDAFVQDYLNQSTSVASGCTSKGQGGYQLNYISMEPIPEWSAWSPHSPTKVIHSQSVEKNVQNAMAQYDFLLLNERMDESLVLLQLLLGLETSDILSLSFNVGGSYRYEHGKCKQLVKSHISPGMQAYFESDEWYAKNYGDYLLYAAGNRSLDMTIEQLGRTRFDAAMQEFHRLEAKVNGICPQQVPFPCSANGTVLFHTDQPVPHAKIDECIDMVVRQEVQSATASLAIKEDEQ